MKTSNFASRTQVKNPRCVPLGIPPFLGGIPSDPTWDYGTSCMGSHQLKLGSCHRFLIAPTWEITSQAGLNLKSHQFPPGILPQISDSFPPGKSYPRWDHTWDPANPRLNPTY